MNLERCPGLNSFDVHDSFVNPLHCCHENVTLLRSHLCFHIPMNDCSTHYVGIPVGNNLSNVSMSLLVAEWFVDCGCDFLVKSIAEQYSLILP